MYRLCLSLLLLISLFFTAIGQQPVNQEPAKPKQTEPDQDEVVRISTNLVQIDAVVTDKNGRQITDLTADDFILKEDDREQKITNVSYVSVGSPSSTLAAQPKASVDPKQQYVPPPPVKLRPEQVHRTLALVVDDLGLSFESMNYVRQALRKFVDTKMNPGDLVAIIRTSAGAGALQQFTADQRQLYAAIERLRWYPLGRSGIGSFDPIRIDPLSRLDSMLPPEAHPSEVKEAHDDDQELRAQVFTVGTLGATQFVVQSMREMPGRKSVLLISDGIRLMNQANLNNSAGGPNAGSSKDARETRDEGFTGVLDSLQQLTDIANRASVVIYAMDPRGLQALGITAADDLNGFGDQHFRSSLANRHKDFLDSQEGMNYLAKQTGGFFIHDTNDLGAGVQKVLDDQKGYYLIGYRPDDSTFDPVTGRRMFHHVAVSLRRSDLTVRSRTGFFGVTDEQVRARAKTPEQQMLTALVSPFAAGDVHLRLATLFVSDSSNGAVMRSLLHIDGRDLTFKEEPDGWYRISFEIMAVTFGENGITVDRYDSMDSLKVRDDGYKLAKEQGIVYTLNTPVKKPGAYQLRIAVRDAASNKIGSANQFIQVPDLKKGALALSGVAITGMTVSPAQVLGQAQNVSAQPPGAPAIPVVANIKTAYDPQANPAVRRFHPGMTLEYACAIYNAKVDGKTHAPQLQTQLRLFREGELVYSSPVAPFDTNSQADMKKLTLLGAIKLGAGTKPGEYFLQVIVTDPLAKKERQVASEYVGFDLVEQ